MDAQKESHGIRSLRRRIEALESLVPGAAPSTEHVLHEFDAGHLGLNRGTQRRPKHLAIQLPEDPVDEKVAMMRSTLLAEMLSVNLELRRALGERRPGA